ncbi:MAG: polyphosphate kinase 2 family protein [Flaviflexus sp.]|nr:polyphosphate kinase 2 family protein [Flaviflexus sp.]
MWELSPRLALKAGDDFDLETFDRSATPGFSGDKKEGEEYLASTGELLSELQERLFAEGKRGGKRSVLLVIQGLDTAGKGGIVRHVVGQVDPQGVAITGFGKPTKVELDHHFLWRIKRALPEPGKIGVFDRSHYEDVLIARVDKLVKEQQWRGRYREINNFEKRLVDGGTTVIKVALMCSKDEQAARILERIERPDKQWKHVPGDLDTRAKWDAYQAAYADVFRYTSTEYAPWYVIPADHKWYARAAVTELLLQTLIDLDPQWPSVRWNHDVQRRRLFETVDENTAKKLLANALEDAAKAEDKEVAYRAALADASEDLSDSASVEALYEDTISPASAEVSDPLNPNDDTVGDKAHKGADAPAAEAAGTGGENAVLADGSADRDKAKKKQDKKSGGKGATSTKSTKSKDKKKSKKKDKKDSTPKDKKKSKKKDKKSKKSKK